MSLTVSVISKPNQYEPVGIGTGGLWFQFSSPTSSSSLPSFKYVVSLFSVDPQFSAQTTNLGTYKIPPYIDSTGLFSVADTLSSQLTYNYNPFITTWTNCPNSIVKYYVQYGLEYNPGFTYSGGFNHSGNLGLTMSIPFDIQVSDSILIDKNNLAINPQYNGYHTVTATSSTTVITNEAYATYSISPGYTESGSITDLIRNIGTSSYFYAFNGSKQYNQINENFGTLYVATNSTYVTQNFLTNYNSYTFNFSQKQVYLSNYETLSLLIDPLINSPNIVLYSLYNNLNNLISPTATASIPFLLNSHDKRVDIPSGPANLTALGVNLTGINYYIVSVIDHNTNVLADMFYQIVTNCSPYPNIRLAFLNLLGGFDYWNFNWKNQQTTNIQKVLYNVALPFNYSIGQRTENVLSQKANDTYTISSDWLQDFDATFLRELLLSPIVYVVDEVNNLSYPITILDSSYAVKTKLNNQLYAITLSFKYAYDINLFKQ